MLQNICLYIHGYTVNFDFSGVNLHKTKKPLYKYSGLLSYIVLHGCQLQPYEPIRSNYLFFFLRTIPLTVSAPAASATGTTVSTTPVGTFVPEPEPTPTVVLSPTSESPAANAHTEQVAIKATEAIADKIFFIVFVLHVFFCLHLSSPHICR